MTLKNFAFWPVQSMCHHVCCRCGFCKGVPFLSLFFFLLIIQLVEMPARKTLAMTQRERSSNDAKVKSNFNLKIEQKRFGVYAIVILWKRVDKKSGLRNHAWKSGLRNAWREKYCGMHVQTSGESQFAKLRKSCFHLNLAKAFLASLYMSTTIFLSSCIS